MRASETDRGFVIVCEEEYLDPHPMTRLIQESSQIGDYEDSADRPGSSYLWVGDKHHLNREQVAELIYRMQHWLITGRLEITERDKHGNP